MKNLKTITKPVIGLLAILLIVVFIVSGCAVRKTGNRITGGKDVQTFTYGWVNLGGEEIAKGYISQWRDYENSDTVQVMIGGKYYLTHYTNVVMVADPEHGSLSYSDPDWFTEE